MINRPEAMFCSDSCIPDVVNPLPFDLTLVRALGGAPGVIPGFGKSNKSAANGHCIEVALTADTYGEEVVLVGDSKDPTASKLIFTAESFREFLGRVARGEAI